MKAAEKGQKVYIISKTYGDSYAVAMDRANQNHGSLQREIINYKGKFIEAIVGFYVKYKMYNENVHVIKYETVTGRGGDFYMRTDFLTKDQVNQIHIDISLPEELFEI